MATYPIKMLKDESGQLFIPLVNTAAVENTSGISLDTLLAAKLEASNIIAGSNISLSKSGNNITISSSDVSNFITKDVNDLTYYTTTTNMNTALGNKVDKVNGKQLSTEDFTTALKTKLEGIATGAEVNVNADWNASSGDAQILNKPTTIAGYGITNAYTKTEVDSAISTAVSGLFVFRGTVATRSALPNNPANGDVYTITDEGGLSVVWDANGNQWVNLSTTIDLTDYQTTAQADAKYVAQVSGKQLSTEDYTSAEKTKLGGIATGAQVNVLESIKVNGTAQTITNKAVDITVPTTLSALTNDGNFVADASYVHTDNNFTTMLKNKLDGLTSTSDLTNDGDGTANTYYGLTNASQNGIYVATVSNVIKAAPMVSGAAVTDGSSNIKYFAYESDIPSVIDNLTSTSTTSALSANQGKVLAGRIIPSGGSTGQVLAKSSGTDYAVEWITVSGGGTSISVIDNLNSASATDALSANQGRVLDGKIPTVYSGSSAPDSSTGKVGDIYIMV